MVNVVKPNSSFKKPLLGQVGSVVITLVSQKDSGPSGGECFNTQLYPSENTLSPNFSVVKPISSRMETLPI